PPDRRLLSLLVGKRSRDLVHPHLDRAPVARVRSAHSVEWEAQLLGIDDTAEDRDEIGCRAGKPSERGIQLCACCGDIGRCECAWPEREDRERDVLELASVPLEKTTRIRVPAA